MNIEQWLDKFSTAWKNHDIEKVMSLFTDDVEYWETPSYKVGSKQQLNQEWQAILDQQDINLSNEVYCSTVDNKHAVRWELSYKKADNLVQSAGLYLITLNDNGQCEYFYYVGESE